MTKIMKVDNPTVANILFNEENVTHRQMGIDTIELIANYETVVKLVEKQGFSLFRPKKAKSNKTFKRVEYALKEDSKRRYKASSFSPIVEMVKLPKVQGRGQKPLLMSIVRNIPVLFDVATHHKQAKDTFCLVIFAGLHQPTKKISHKAMSTISKFTNRKTFKVRSIDVAIDTTDFRSISHKRKESFKEQLAPYSKLGVISKGSSFYINNFEHVKSISRILYYDKYLKQTQHHGQKLSKGLSNWKRLEITLTFDVTDQHNKGFTQYIEGFNFLDDLFDIDEVAKKIGITSYSHDYITYQINSLLDNRFMNNRESKEQFNSVESLARFKQSDFRRYVLAV
ncbi:MAG: Unknown protein [uncultured Sulfurovum sp.]|uniref:Uncharacterized protein n=1 Tax=uncultured Sulfurovum sp. TaxID=269237 RepID=A0A6S6SA79_9BACT|nr:MAG: Unknown protein [uncultured Sulfurovum sp.]